MSKKSLKKMDSFGKKEIEDLTGRIGLIYPRVSSKRHEIEGTGLQSQEGRCKKLLDELNVPYGKTFPDSYTGGGDFMKRPAMREMLEYIDAHPHKNFVVVFDDLKRFARDVEFHIKLKYAFKVRGVILKCANYNFDESPEGEALELVSAIFNELERKQNRRQVIQKQQARLMSGFRAFPAMKGYTRIKDAIHGKIDIQNNHALVVKEALEGFATRRFVHKIDGARFLQDEGVISKKQSADKAITTYDKMLREIFYAGYIQYDPWEVARRIGHHEPIISLETFERNQKRLQSKVSTFIRQDIRKGFELRGLVDCAYCKEKLTGAPSRSKTGKKYDYYNCRNKVCIFYGKSIPTAELHSRFDVLLQEIKPLDEVIELTFAVFEDIWKEEIQNKGKNNKNLISKKTEIEEEIGKLAKLASNVSSEVVIKQYEKQIEKLGNELEEIEGTLTTQFDYTIPCRTSLNEIKEAIKTPYSVWINYDIYQKQRFFAFIFEGNLVYNKKEGFRTPNYALPIRIFEEISTSKPVDVDSVAKSSNTVKRYILEWSEFFKYNPPIFKAI